MLAWRADLVGLWPEQEAVSSWRSLELEYPTSSTETLVTDTNGADGSNLS